MRFAWNPELVNTGVIDITRIVNADRLTAAAAVGGINRNLNTALENLRINRPVFN